MWKPTRPQPPRDENWNLHVNIVSKKRKKHLMENVRDAGNESQRKQTWDSTNKLTKKWVNSPYDPIPEREVRMMVQQIREWLPWRIAAKAIGIPEARAEYFIERWLHYTDKVMEWWMTIEKATFVKNEILKAEADQEKIARLALMQSMKKGNARVAMEFLNKQQDEVQKYFNDTPEYRQIADDMWLSKQEYYWCLNVLNWMSQQKASENVGRAKNFNMYHFRMNPAVKDYIKVIKIKRRQELTDWIEFTKETASAAMTYALWILLDEMQKSDNSKQDKINLAKEIRNTAESMWKATNLFPKEEIKNDVNIAVLASENTEQVLRMLGQKHETHALNITTFTNANTTDDWWADETVEDIVQDESA